MKNRFEERLVKFGLVLTIFMLTFISLQVKKSFGYSIANNFLVGIVNETHDLVYHEAVFIIQNLNSTDNRDFYVGSLFQDTSFDLSLLKDVYIYEWKPVNKTFNNYTFVYTTNYYLYPENRSNFTLPLNCFDYNSTHFACNETISINNPYWAMVLDWKPSKIALNKQGNKIVGSYGYVTISKYGSKCKYDDFNQPYDCNGTKIFKLVWYTPITQILRGFGSYGYYAIYDPVNNISYDPWWNSSWQHRRSITIDNTQNSNDLTDYQVLVTIDTASLISAGKMRSDCGDIRFTDSDDLTQLNYWIESGCNSDNTKIWVKVPFIPANSNKTIYIYYGNPNATSMSNIQNTFYFADDFNGSNGDSYNTTKWVPIFVNTPASGSVRDIQNNTLRIYFASNSYGDWAFYGIRSSSVATPTGFVLEWNMTDVPFVEDDRLTGLTISPISESCGECCSSSLRLYAQAAYYYGWFLQKRIANIPTTLANWQNNKDGSWHKLKLIFRSDKYIELWFDDELKYNETLSDLPFTSGYIYLEQWTKSATLSSTYFDTVRVRKYSFPEPTTSVENEQTFTTTTTTTVSTTTTTTTIPTTTTTIISYPEVGLGATARAIAQLNPLATLIFILMPVIIGEAIINAFSEIKVNEPLKAVIRLLVLIITLALFAVVF